jgi:hypothetical protein
VQIVSLTTGAILGEVAPPNAQSLGLDPSVVVTNAVSVHKDLMFISNGEAGVYVARGDQEFADTGSETLPTITVLGRLGFDQLESVNHVLYRSDHLYVAAGRGGLKIVHVEPGS